MTVGLLRTSGATDLFMKRVITGISRLLCINDLWLAVYPASAFYCVSSNFFVFLSLQLCPLIDSLAPLLAVTIGIVPSG